MAGLSSGALARVTHHLHVIPFPGTPDASPTSQIIFSSLGPTDIRSVTVVGSRSGAHTGRLVALPDRAGTAFLPDRPFATAELVRVGAVLRSRRAGTAEGAPNALTLGFSFTVAVRQANQRRRPAVSIVSGPTQRFHSRPDLHPPLVSVSHDSDTSSGDIFLTTNHNTQPGPMILDSQGRLIWFQPPGKYTGAYNLEVQTYQGQPVLTWWAGVFMGAGEDVIMDHSYRTLAILRAKEGYSSDLHEFQITPQGTALVDIYSPVRADLSGVGGSKNGVVTDCLIQELDIRTGRLLWEWHALGHIPLSASYTGKPDGIQPYDFFHINSIQQLPDGNFLVSSRSDWALYEINRRTGNVMWKLGGKNSNFRMRPGTGFEWQHDAHLGPGGILTLFDDGAVPREERQSSAKTLRVNRRTMTVSLVHRITHAPGLLAGLAGSVQTLPNTNLMVGWGSQSAFSEYTSSGRQVFDGRFPLGVYTYRAYRFPWVGQPSTRPLIAQRLTSSGVPELYASWNGATQVARWRALGGRRKIALHPLAAHGPWAGFETALRLHSEPRYVAVEALDSAGHVLATSAVHLDAAYSHSKLPWPGAPG